MHRVRAAGSLAIVSCFVHSVRAEPDASGRPRYEQVFAVGFTNERANHWRFIISHHSMALRLLTRFGAKCNKEGDVRLMLA